MLTATVTSRAFSSGLEIRTPEATFKTKDVSLSPLSSETRILDSLDNQVARVQAEGFLSDTTDIIITGAGFYQFGSDLKASTGWNHENWICKGEGRTLNISQQNSRSFIVCDDSGEIATCLKPSILNDYTITVRHDSDLKLTICIFVALFRSQQSSDAFLL